MLLIFKNDAACEDFTRRFWSRADKSLGPDACWLWCGCIGTDGYGQMRANRVSSRAHRIAWSMSNGPIPDGLCVCHKCDVRACVNPSHMLLGTNEENSADRHNKGRGVWPEPQRGSRNANAKITEDDVREILSRLARGEASTVIAAEYRLAKGTIDRIALGQTWRHVTRTREASHAR